MSVDWPHQYDSGVYHDTHPDDVVSCCDKPPGDPIHLPPPPPARTCDCDRYWFRHFYDATDCKGDPMSDIDAELMNVIQGGDPGVFRTMPQLAARRVLERYVVLDLEATTGGEFLIDWLRHWATEIALQSAGGRASVSNDMRYIADQIEAQTALRGRATYGGTP